MHNYCGLKLLMLCLIDMILGLHCPNRMLCSMTMILGQLMHNRL